MTTYLDPAQRLRRPLADDGNEKRTIPAQVGRFYDTVAAIWRGRTAIE